MLIFNTAGILIFNFSLSVGLQAKQRKKLNSLKKFCTLKMVLWIRTAIQFHDATVSLTATLIIIHIILAYTFVDIFFLWALEFLDLLKFRYCCEKKINFIRNQIIVE